MTQPVFRRDLYLRAIGPAFYGTAIVVLLLESAAAFLLTWKNGLLLAGSIHAVTLALITLMVRLRDRHYDNRFAAFMLPAVAVTGPFGALFCLLAALTHRFSSGDAESPAEWIEKLFERDAEDEGASICERIAMGLDTFKATENVMPFRDILAGGTTLQKQAAVAKISRYFRPQFAPLLLQAARNSNAAVRVQAATALAKIERDFMMRYINLENTFKNIPDHDPAKLKLADLYDDYAYANLLDDQNRHALREKAIHLYESCLGHEDRPEWRVRAARLYLRHEQPEKARQLLRPLVEKNYCAALYWYMEALFRLKQYAALRDLADTYATDLMSYNGPGKDILQAWQLSKEARHAA
ncbi:MAG: hypothetical protein WCD70_06185 [Alphaproteobacteria bacterium]